LRHDGGAEIHAQRGMMRRLLLASVLLLAGCIQPKPLDDFGAAPPFQLTDQAGRPFDSRGLAGHIWVADFIYTTCTGPCPMMSQQMHQLQQSTAQEMADVKLVSFTVDPSHDTPPVLAEYARHFAVDAARWSFLTGAQPQLNQVGLGFKLNTVDGSLSHSTRFALVDRRGHIRGYYMTSEDAFMPRLMHDIRQLER
jgi:protein SCO1/2